MLGRLLGNNTPPYQGQTQQAGSKAGGLLSFFTGGFALFPKTPVYATASPAPVVTHTSTTGEPPTETVASPGEDAPINGEAETAEEPATKRITIIVTPGPGTTVEDVAAFFRDRCGLDG